MCRSTTRRSRPASGASTSGTTDATRPSTRTTEPEGIRASAAATADRAGASGRGHRPGTVCSWTDQPSAESPRQARRSYTLPPLGRRGSSIPSGTTTCTSFTTTISQQHLSQRPFVARPRDVRLAQGHRDPGRPTRGVPEPAAPAARDRAGEPVRDQPREDLGGCVAPRELRHLVKIAVVEVRQDATQLLGGPADIHHDVVGVELEPGEGRVHDVRRSVQALRGTEYLAAEAV